MKRELAEAAPQREKENKHLLFPPVSPALISALSNHRSFVYQVSTLIQLTSSPSSFIKFAVLPQTIYSKITW